MGRERKGFGFAGDMAVGCLLDIVLVTCFALAVGEDRLASAFAYAIVLSVPVWGLRWLLSHFGMLDGWCGRLLGPAVLVGAMLLSVFCPIKTEDKPGAGQNVNAAQIAGDAGGHGSFTTFRTGSCRLRPEYVIRRPPPTRCPWKRRWPSLRGWSASSR